MVNVYESNPWDNTEAKSENHSECTDVWSMFMKAIHGIILKLRVKPNVKRKTVTSQNDHVKRL